MGWSGPMTHRQYVVWQAWFDQEWERPSRTDHYLMLVAHEARYAGKPKKPGFSSKEYRIEFKKVPQKAAGNKGMTVEQATAVAKAKWGLTVPKEKRREKGGAGDGSGDGS